MKEKINTLSKQEALELSGLLIILAHNGKDVAKTLRLVTTHLREQFNDDENKAIKYVEQRVNQLLGVVKTGKKPAHTKDKSDKVIHLWTDGSSYNNGEYKGCGGYGYVLLYGDFKDVDHYIEYCGRKYMRTGYGSGRNTTNQQEEIRSVIAGLKQITSPHVPIEVFSDSAYLVNCMNQRWYEKWERNGWKNSQGAPVSNVPLWKELLSIIRDKNLQVTFTKIKGHNGYYYNEMADDLAKKGTEEAVAQKQK